MKKTIGSKWKTIIDSILVYNVYILIIGSIFLGISYAISFNGNTGLFNLFQKLWYPFFIPSLSLFFTAILTDALYNKLTNINNK